VAVQLEEVTTEHRRECERHQKTHQHGERHREAEARCLNC
jgi:hypothetical protein